MRSKTPMWYFLFKETQGLVKKIDNARPHRANHTINHLRVHNVQPLLWSSKSADLNPNNKKIYGMHLTEISNDSQYNHKTLHKSGRPLYRNGTFFRQSNKLCRLISSMRRRCQALNGSRGFHMRY